jgi:hypothetical protein
MIQKNKRKREKKKTGANKAFDKEHLAISFP